MTANQGGAYDREERCSGIRSSVRVTRREFMTSIASVSAASMVARRLIAQTYPGGAVRLASDPLRPQFHLLPPGNWMNDPNGPIYFNGQYHMFFQFNPNGSLWGDMHWAHSVSQDMIHWRHLPIALSPTPGGPDSAGCFTGSAIVVGKRVYLVYTGVADSLPAKATLRDGKHNYLESQCLAWSDDPELIHWTKEREPIIPDPPKGMPIVGFRDPSVWKQGGHYYMTVGTGRPRIGGGALLYRSNDLRKWTYLHMLASGSWNSKVAINPVASAEMWECPELFGLDGRHVLIYSTEGKVFWETGQLDDQTMMFHGERRGLLDYGRYYAPKTQLDSAGNRILWGWIPETRSDSEILSAGWAGMMSLPRVLSLDTEGALRMQFLPELTKLRVEPGIPDVPRTSETRVTFSGGAGEALITGSTESEAFDVIVRTSFGEKPILQLNYVPAHRMIVIDGEKLGVSLSGAPHLHIYFDGSVVELVVNHQLFYTKRFYYDDGRAPDISLQVAGQEIEHVKLSLWKINSISNDRLTSPGQAR